MRLTIIPLLCTFVALPAWSQDSEEDITVAEEPAVEAPEPEPEEEPEPDFDDTGLDEQGFADEDDDFDPTEEIPTDQSIEFPTDI